MSETHVTPETVFVTDGFPQLTYVDQSGGLPEKELKEGLAQANKVVSIVGESKTGKTTLCDKVFGTQPGADKILIPGSQIASSHTFWSEAFRQLNLPMPSGFAYNAIGETVDRLIQRGLPVVVDDFHYVERDIQKVICREMKNAASRGLRFVVLSTPHRSDDPVRSNPDMSGRFFEVNVGFWSNADLMEIGRKGFSKLNLRVDEGVLEKLAEQSLRSPQLMQTLCLELCRVLPADVPFEHQHVTAANFDFSKVRGKAVRSYNFSTQLSFLREGPDERGKPRNIFILKDGSKGDVYQILVRALAIDPPFLTIVLDQIKQRASTVVAAGQGQPNIKTALDYVNGLFKDGTPPLQWDDQKKSLTIVDPHFYFYLRFIGK